VSQPSFFFYIEGSRFKVYGKPYVNPKALGEEPQLFKAKGVCFGATFERKEAVK